jgi:phospholipid transport system substrate-binding protein
MTSSGTRAYGAELSSLALALILSVGSAGVADAAAAGLGPLELVKSSMARVLAIGQSSPMASDERRTGLVGVSHELFDFNEITRRALGQHWTGLSPGEQDEFVQLFTDVLDRAFIASVDAFTGQNVAFVGEAIDGARAHVRSRVMLNTGAAISIDYRLHEVNARWTVYDVAWEQVSLVANYRSQFNSVIRASSFAQLLERMRASRLPRREPSTQTLFVPDRLAAGLLLGALTRHAPTSR